MKQRICLIVSFIVSMSCVQSVVPAKQVVKAYKTALKDETWTVAIFNPANPKKPISIASFRSSTSILPGRGLSFDFDANPTNLVRVYPTEAKDAKICIAKETDRGCGKVRELSVTKATAPATIKIEVIDPNPENPDYIIVPEAPKRDTIVVGLKKSCDNASLGRYDCESPWLVEIYNDQEQSMGFTQRLGMKPATIRIPASQPFWVYATKRQGEEPVKQRIDNFSRKFAKTNVIIIPEEGEIFMTSKGSIADKAIDALRLKPSPRKQNREQQFGGL